jgi:hypothetical protein
MTWNYRVVRATEDEDSILQIHEAYYDHYGAVYAITEKPVPVVGDNQLELVETLTMMMAALNKPILSWEDMNERREATEGLLGEA